MRRTKWLQIRMSEQELSHLDAVRGAKPRSDHVRDLIAAQSVHRHRRAVVVGERFERGSKVEIWACDCGQEMT